MASAELSFAAKVKLAWSPVPDWIAELANMADRLGLKAAGIEIGYTGSLISGVLNNKYKGDLAAVEAAVRWSLTSKTVDCPVIGEINRRRCLEEQKAPFRATSAMRAQLFHACRNGCPHARPAKGDTNGAQ